MKRLTVMALAALCLWPASAGASSDPQALFAQNQAAAGGSAWNRVAAVSERGTSLSGGASSTFQIVVDRRRGFSHASIDNGPLHDVNGYDGVPWDAQNGTLTVTDLPALLADAVTQAYAARDGWWTPGSAAMELAGERVDGALDADVVRVTPPGGSAIDVWIDRKTHLIVRTVAHADTGDDTTTYDDFRATSGVMIPFHNLEVAATGATTETTIETALLLPALDPSAFARPPTPNRASFAGGAPSVVPFRFDAGDAGHIVLPVTFDERPLTVFFDSGGQNVLTPDAAKQLALATGGGAEVNGVGNASVAASFARIGVVAAGTARLSDQDAVVLPLPYAAVHPAAGIAVQGLIGSEMLENFRTTVDYAARTIAFAPFGASAPAGPGVVRFYTDGPHAYVEAVIDGVAGIFGIDTGDGGGLTIFRRFADAHHLFVKGGIPFTSPGGVGGQVSGYSYRAGSLAIAGTTLQAPTVAVTEASAGAFASRSIAGNIGARILARFTISFDYAHHVMAFRPNAHANDPFVGNRTGLSLTQTDPGAFIVIGVAPASPAREAGLKAGDRIVAVDGASVAEKHIGGGDLLALLVDPTRTTIAFVVDRAGTTVDVTLKLRELL